MLQLSNILPHRYLDLYAIKKDIGVKYKAIDAFPSDHIIYYG